MDLSTYLMLRVSSDSKDARADGESSMLMMSVSPIPVAGGVWLSRACLPIQIPVFFSPVSGLVVFHFRGCETVLDDPVSGRPVRSHCPIHIGAGFLLGNVGVHCGPGG